MGKNKKCKDKVNWGVESVKTDIFDDVELMEMAREKKKKANNPDFKNKPSNKKDHVDKKNKRIRYDDNERLPSYMTITKQKEEARRQAAEAIRAMKEARKETVEETDASISEPEEVNDTEKSSEARLVNKSSSLIINTTSHISIDEPNDQSTVVDKTSKDDDVDTATDNPDVSPNRNLLITGIEYLKSIDRLIINDTISPHSIDIKDLDGYPISEDYPDLTNDEFYDSCNLLFKYIIASTHPTLILQREKFLKLFKKYQEIDSNRFLIVESDDHSYFALWSTPDIVEKMLMEYVPKEYDMGIMQSLRLLAVLAVEGNKISNVFKMSNDDASREYVEKWVNYLDNKFGIDNIISAYLKEVDDDYRTVVHDNLDNVADDAAKNLAYSNMEMKLQAHDEATSICYFQEMDLYDTDDDDEDDDDDDDPEEIDDNEDDSSDEENEIIDIDDDSQIDNIMNANDKDDDDDGETDLPTNFPARSKS